MLQSLAMQINAGTGCALFAAALRPGIFAAIWQGPFIVERERMQHRSLVSRGMAVLGAGGACTREAHLRAARMHSSESSDS